ncbi:MAG: YadA-like family protein [Pseudobutyrivibrio sp.]|nr:YadA-like family protein [Pseudobutyrivibrio sp.]
MNKEFIITIIVLTIALTFCLAQDAKGAVAYDNMDSSFETIVKGDDLQKIETWEQPRTQYTPGNLRSQYQIRFSGKDGANKVTSYTLPITDYDTYINAICKDEETGKMYVHDNAGRKILTGIDNSKQINEQGKQIEEVSNSVQNIDKRVQNISNSILDTKQQISSLDKKLEGGLATVTALTSLHPNPRSNEKLEVSIGTGMYADNVAGAVGIFYHPNDRVQIGVGASYGGDSQFAGSIGITFGLGKRK